MSKGNHRTTHKHTQLSRSLVGCEVSHGKEHEKHILTRLIKRYLISREEERQHGEGGSSISAINCVSTNRKLRRFHRVDSGDSNERSFSRRKMFAECWNPSRK